MNKIIKYTTTQPLIYLLNWEIVKYMNVVSADKQAQTDIDLLLDKYKLKFDNQEKIYIDNQEKIKLINTEIDYYQKELIIRQGLIYLLDGKFDDLFDTFSNAIDIREFESNDNQLRRNYEVLKKYLEELPLAELNFTIDMEKPKVSVNVKILERPKIFSLFLVVFHLSRIISSQNNGKEKLEFPKEFASIGKGLFNGLIGRISSAQLIRIIYKPLVLIQLHREYLKYLVEKRSSFSNQLGTSDDVPSWLIYSEFAKKNSEIQIKSEFIPFVLAKLTPYFSQEDLSILSDIFYFKNDHNDKRVLFNGNGSKIGYFFLELHDKEIIGSKKKLITELFLINHIDYISQKTKATTPFSKDMAHKYLSPTQTLKGKDTIDLSDINEFIEK